MKTLDLMKVTFLAQLQEVTFNAITIERGESDVKDAAGNVTGKQLFVKVGTEVPKRNGIFSKMRFDVKIPDGKMKLEQAKLDEEDYIVSFTNLEISFIDAKGNVYFRASDYEITEEALL